MNITKDNIDGGKAFDWGRTSEDYAKFRDIYPAAFYDDLVKRGLCVKGQSVLDLGTGTGVLPRNLYRYGAKMVRHGHLPGADRTGEAACGSGGHGY